MSVGLVSVLALGLLPVLPATMAAALAADCLWRRSFVLTRSVLFFTAFVWLELLGLAAAAWIWLRTLGGTRGRALQFLEANQHLQVAWNQAVFATGARLFGVHVHLDNPHVLTGTGPVVVLVRHVSTVDTVLPIVLLSPVGRRSFRFVLKHALLADPCLDVVGQRLPNHFVRRGLEDNSQEVTAIAQLAASLTHNDALVMFPEGGRFSLGRRRRLLARLSHASRAKDLAYAQSLTHTLPPLTNGTLVALAAARDAGAGVLIMGHRGLDGTAGFPQFAAGGLVHARVDVKLWRIEAAQLTGSPQQLAEVLCNHWREMDAWVASGVRLTERNPAPVRGPAPPRTHPDP